MRDDCINPKINARARHFIRKRRVAQAFRAAGFDQMAEHLDDCQEVNRQIICLECGHVHYVEQRCRQRTCPLCSFRESRRRGDWIKRMCHGMAFPKMLTLTMPRWTQVPGLGIDYIRSCFNLLRKQPVFSKVKGGVYQIELIRKEGGWHIHMHVILDCPFLPYQKILAAWSSILGVPCSRIDIRAAKTDAQMFYVAKYAAKAADYEGDISHVVEWWQATKGKRLFAGFGSWYNQEPPAGDADTDPHSKKFPCPNCGAEDSCVSGESIGFIVGRDAAPLYRQALSAAGPPKISKW